MDNITTYIAIYGAVLSTLVFLWDVIKHLKDKPDLQVEAGYHALVGQLPSELKLGIRMINKGRRPITIVASGFKLDTKSNENMVTIHDPSLPKEITEGQNHITFANPDEIDSNKILFAWVRDATGRVYRSKKRPLPSKKS